MAGTGITSDAAHPRSGGQPNPACSGLAALAADAAVRRGHSSGRCSSELCRVSEHLMKPRTPARTALPGVQPTLTGATFGSTRNSDRGLAFRPPRPALCISPRGDNPVHDSCGPAFPSASVRTRARALRRARMPISSSGLRRPAFETPRHSDTAAHFLSFYCGQVLRAVSAHRVRSSTPPRESQQGDERDQGANPVAPSALPASLVGRPSTSRIT
jgi:hypothetical protein